MPNPHDYAVDDQALLHRELAVAVTNEKARPDGFVVEPHQQVACLLAHPAAVPVGRDPGQVHAATLQLDEEQEVEPLQKERVDREEVALEDARRLPAKKLRPACLQTLWRRPDPLRGFKNVVQAAARWYSWMSPPRMSRRSILATIGRVTVVAGSGGCSASARWGRSRL